jgi:hypothetical protein
MRARTSSGSAPSDAAVNPTTSQKRTDTTRRSVTAGSTVLVGCRTAGEVAEDVHLLEQELPAALWEALS